MLEHPWDENYLQNYMADCDVYHRWRLAGLSTDKLPGIDSHLQVQATSTLVLSRAFSSKHTLEIDGCRFYREGVISCSKAFDQGGRQKSAQVFRQPTLHARMSPARLICEHV